MSKEKKIINITFDPSIPQYTALQYLFDKTTNFIGYGGSAFSGKSYLMCKYLLQVCYMYPQTTWGLGRKELTTLKKTTLLTLFKVFSEAGLTEGEEYKYNQQLNVINFSNGSKIFLIDTAYKPSDPLYQRFGGYELTGCCVDESAETDELAIGILFTRCGRKNNAKYGLVAKMLETFNPARNHVYRRYYAPHTDGIMKHTYKFIKALPKDNPSPEVEDYVKGIMENADEQTIQRLVFGNFDYSDDDANLIPRVSIAKFLKGVHMPKTILQKWHNDDKYITVDPARKGKDQTQIMVWYGLTIIACVTLAISSVPETVEAVHKLATEHNISLRNVVVDSDGVGGGVADYLDGCLEFVNNARAFSGENFENAKSQCYYRLATEVEAGNVKLFNTVLGKKALDAISEELSCVKAKALLSDGKKGIISKDIVKKIIGRSPDYSDAMMMRMAFMYTRKSQSDVYFT